MCDRSKICFLYVIIFVFIFDELLVFVVYDLRLFLLFFLYYLSVFAVFRVLLWADAKKKGHIFINLVDEDGEGDDQSDRTKQDTAQ